MKIAAYLATLFVRLLGVFGLFASGSLLLMVMGSAAKMQGGSMFAVVLVLQFGASCVAVVMAGRVVQLFTADAPLGNE